MAERYPGDGAAANGFGRRILQAWEARLLCKAGYMAPPDTRTPPGWKLSVGDIPIPPVPTPEELPYEIQEYIGAMDDPSDAETAWRRAMSGHALAYQGAPLFVLGDDEEDGPSYKPWRCGDPGQGSSRQHQPPSDDDDGGGEDDGRADPGYTAFYSNFGM